MRRRPQARRHAALRTRHTITRWQRRRRRRRRRQSPHRVVLDGSVSGSRVRSGRSSCLRCGRQQRQQLRCRQQHDQVLQARHHQPSEPGAVALGPSFSSAQRPQTACTKEPTTTTMMMMMIPTGWCFNKQFLQMHMNTRVLVRVCVRECAVCLVLKRCFAFNLRMSVFHCFCFNIR